MGKKNNLNLWSQDFISRLNLEDAVHSLKDPNQNFMVPASEAEIQLSIAQKLGYLL